MTTTITPPTSSSNTAPSPRRVMDVAIDRLTDALTAHSVNVLRVSLGVVFLLFASFKFVLGASPAEDLAIATVSKLTFGIVTGTAALYLTAVTETTIGITLVTGRFLKIGLLVLAGALVGIMSPLMLLPDLMWADKGPTLTGQYVFKDIVLIAAGMVAAADELGARLHRADSS